MTRITINPRRVLRVRILPAAKVRCFPTIRKMLYARSSESRRSEFVQSMPLIYRMLWKNPRIFARKAVRFPLSYEGFATNPKPAGCRYGFGSKELEWIAVTCAAARLSFLVREDWRPTGVPKLTVCLLNSRRCDNTISLIQLN